MLTAYVHLAELFLAGPERCREVYTPEEWEGFFQQEVPFPKLKDVFEFNRLFVGPFAPAAPPFASVYLSREDRPALMGEVTMQVRRFYREQGIELRMKNETPDDFLGFEMEFLGLCLANEASESHDRFLREHMAVWVPLWAKRVQEQTRNPFCKRLAEYITRLVQTEAAGEVH